MLFWSAAFLAAQSRHWADPLADLAKSSSVGQVDLAELAGGKVMCVRGPTLSAARDLSVQSVYVIHAPVAKTLEMHKQWDAAKHPELKVYLHHDLPANPRRRISRCECPRTAAVRELIAATLKLPESKGLQLSNDEAKSFPWLRLPGGARFLEPASLPARLDLRKGWREPGSLPTISRAAVRARRARWAGCSSEQPKIHAAFRPIIGEHGISRALALLGVVRCGRTRPISCSAPPLA